MISIRPYQKGDCSLLGLSPLSPQFSSDSRPMGGGNESPLYYRFLHCSHVYGLVCHKEVV